MNKTKYKHRLTFTGKREWVSERERGMDGLPRPSMIPIPIHRFIHKQNREQSVIITKRRKSANGDQEDDGCCVRNNLTPAHVFICIWIKLSRIRDGGIGMRSEWVSRWFKSRAQFIGQKDDNDNDRNDRNDDDDDDYGECRLCLLLVNCRIHRPNVRTD